MGLWQAPTVTNDMDLKQLKNLVAILINELDFVINGNISSKNVREIGGFRVGDDYLRSKNGLVGMSSAKLGGDLDDVRLWAGHSNPALAPFRVYNSGKAELSNIRITGGTIEWNNVNSDPAIPILPAYIKSTYIDETNVISPNITGGVVTGALVRTAELGARVELQSGALTAFQSSGIQGIKVDANFTMPRIDFYNSSGGIQSNLFLDSLGVLNIVSSGGVHVSGGSASASIGTPGSTTIIFGNAMLHGGTPFSSINQLNSSASTISEIVGDFNTLLANLRAMRILA